MNDFSGYLPKVREKKRVVGGVVVAQRRSILAKLEFENIKKTGMVTKGKPIITNKKFSKFLSFSGKFSKGAEQLR
jgi:hypothetical protein